MTVLHLKTTGICISAFVCTVLFSACTYNRAPEYTGNGVIQIPSEYRDLWADQSGQAGLAGDMEDVVAREIELIKSDLVLKRAAEQCSPREGTKLPKLFVSSASGSALIKIKAIGEDPLFTDSYCAAVMYAYVDLKKDQRIEMLIGRIFGLQTKLHDLNDRIEECEKQLEDSQHKTEHANIEQDRDSFIRSKNELVAHIRKTDELVSNDIGTPKIIEVPKTARQLHKLLTDLKQSIKTNRTNMISVSNAPSRIDTDQFSESLNSKPQPAPPRLTDNGQPQDG